MRFATRTYLSIALILIVFSLFAASDTPPLPEDTGVLHLYQLLQKLGTTARIMQTTAHPDDEDGGMLTLQSRGKGGTVLLFTITRGEGGQNKFGAESSDELGILRTLELLQAGKYYGVEQRFSHVVDFGFSKTADETFNKWQGHDLALGDMVRVIRTFRPDVLIARFSGSPRDGHGNHEASGVLTKEAFRAAADPHRFPEQLKQGLLPWQAKKLYIGNQGEEYTLRLDTGAYSPVLGMSYVQFALEGLAHQTSQGVGGLRAPAGHRYTSYKRLDTTLSGAASRENDYLDGIDTSLPALADRLEGEESKAPFLRTALAGIAKHVTEATALLSLKDPTACAAPLQAGLAETTHLISQVEASPLSAAAKSMLLTNLGTKRDQFELAANEALGILFEASVDSGNSNAGPSPFFRGEQTFLLATPGQSFTLTARLHNRNKIPVTPDSIHLNVPVGWSQTIVKSENMKTLEAGDSASVQFRVSVSEDAAYTRPYWSRQDPQTENAYVIANPELTTLPLPAYPVTARAIYSTANGKGEAAAIAQLKFIDPTAGQMSRPLAVGPPLSINLQTPTAVIPVRGGTQTPISVGVRSTMTSPLHAKLWLEAPPGWKVEPASLPIDLDHEGDVNSYSFTVTPQNVHEANYRITAKAEYKGKEYAEGFKVITRPDLDSFYAYHPSVQNVQAVDVKLPAQLKVGYLMGAGDEIPAVLGSLGLRVEQISPQELVSGDLSRYDTIVLGIRAYDVRTDVREQNRRLLDYVSHGGTLIVQYNQSIGAFNEGHYTPYPATLSTARVSVEEAAVEVLIPEDPIFSYPNKITGRDFDNWVQERGLYFMSNWDDHLRPMLSSHDPGESAQKGGLLIASYGKGTYVYTGLAFFRQLPAGVPGPIRLFVNLLCAGHKPASTGKEGQ